MDSSKKNDEERKEFTHEDLITLTREAINNVIENDPLLSVLPADVTIEEIKSQIAVAQGQAITLYLVRGKLPKLSIVVPPHNTTVRELKRAIRRHTSLSLKRENVKKKISWRHVWRKYHLCIDRIKLSDDSKDIKFYGISNKSELHFAKKRREKNKLMSH